MVPPSVPAPPGEPRYRKPPERRSMRGEGPTSRGPLAAGSVLAGSLPAAIAWGSTWLPPDALPFVDGSSGFPTISKKTLGRYEFGRAVRKTAIAAATHGS